MRYLPLFENFLKENPSDNKIIFVRTRKFDNRGATNKLPYEGIQCWVIYENDYDKYIDELELWGGRKRDVEIVNPDGYDVYALNYPQTHKYVMGETETIPKLEIFDKTKHVLKFTKNEPKHLPEYISDLASGRLCYQIILK
jgi:hypothetical protein